MRSAKPVNSARATVESRFSLATSWVNSKSWAASSVTRSPNGSVPKRTAGALGRARTGHRALRARRGRWGWTEGSSQKLRPWPGLRGPASLNPARAYGRHGSRAEAGREASGRQAGAGTPADREPTDRQGPPGGQLERSPRGVGRSRTPDLPNRQQARASSQGSPPRGRETAQVARGTPLASGRVGTPGPGHGRWHRLS